MPWASYSYRLLAVKDESWGRTRKAYRNEVACLLDGCMDIKRESGVHFGGYSAGHDLEDFGAKFNQKSIKSGVDFLIQVFTLQILSVLA